MPSAEEINALASILAPGIVILWIRGRFRGSTDSQVGERLLRYALVSIAYNAIATPIFRAPNGVALDSWAWSLLFYFIVPTVVGLAIAFFDRSEVFYKVAAKLGFSPLHHSPTAWEYAFANRRPSYVLVHLKNGSKIAGEWADGAFASHVPGERDILLERLWTNDEDEETWTPIEPKRSALICQGDIQIVEFIEGS